MKKLLLIFMLLAVPVHSAHNPIGFKKWHNGGSSFSTQIGGSVRNYQIGQTWAQINNSFIAEGDSVFRVDASVIKTRVNKNGESSSTLTWGGADYVITQKLLGIGWLKISTRGRQWIDNTMNWSNVSIDSNIVTWTGISPGVDYRVRKQNGQVEHGIFFKPAFLDSAVILYNQRTDSLDIALANVMVYTLSGNIDNADSGLGELSFRQLKSFGEYTFKLTDQRLNHPGSDTLQKIPVKQFWRKRNDSLFCIEYVMMSDVKAVHTAQPSATIWHNDTKKIEGTTNVEDTFILSASPDHANGGSVLFSIRSGSGTRQALIRAKNLATEIGVGATITNAVCSVFCTSSNAGSFDAFSVFKPWVEGDDDFVDNDDGDATYNDWASDANEWGTAGCACANDDGSDNSQDGTCDASGRDRKSTAESNTTYAAGWLTIDITDALAQSWYDETKNEEGLLLKAQGATGTNQYASTENATASERPFFVFTFTVAGGTTLEGVTLEGVTIE